MCGIIAASSPMRYRPKPSPMAQLMVRRMRGPQAPVLGPSPNSPVNSLDFVLRVLCTALISCTIAKGNKVEHGGIHEEHLFASCHICFCHFTGSCGQKEEIKTSDRGRRYCQAARQYTTRPARRSSVDPA